jgi:hypothetical protein
LNESSEPDTLSGFSRFIVFLGVVNVLNLNLLLISECFGGFKPICSFCLAKSFKLNCIPFSYPFALGVLLNRLLNIVSWTLGSVGYLDPSSSIFDFSKRSCPSLFMKAAKLIFATLGVVAGTLTTSSGFKIFLLAEY